MRVLKNLTTWLFISVLAILVAGITYLSQRSDDITIAPKHTIRFQLQWFDQAQFAGFYVAQSRGYYRDEGLDVKILPGGYNINPVTQVFNRDADIGLATGDQVLVRASRGHDVVAVSTVFNKSLLCFMAFADSQITTVKDFKNRKVGVYSGFDSDNVLRSLLHRHKIKEDELEIVQAGSLAAFEQRDVDVWPSYIINEPLTMRQKNRRVNCIKPDDFGVSYYSDTIIVRPDFLAQNRQIVIAFLRASIRGWQAAEKDPAEALKAMYDLSGTVQKTPQTEVHQFEMLKETIKHLREPSDGRMLTMNKGRWIAMASDLIEIDRIINPRQKAAALVDKVVDFQVVEEAYKTLK